MLNNRALFSVWVLCYFRFWNGPIASSGTGESESTASATVLEYSQYAQCVNFKYVSSSF